MKNGMTRKEFLKVLGLGAASLCCSAPVYLPARNLWGSDDIRGEIFKGDAPKSLWRWSREALHYSTDGALVQCHVCPNRCLLAPGDRSVCRSRVNVGGKLFTLAYGNPCAVHVDPIEKKPLNHFFPQTQAFSIATTGCNFRCLNCQNWEISQKRPDEVDHMELFPADVVKKATEAAIPTIAYTYAEPVTFYEYVLDTAVAARSAGLKNVLISNGYINPDPLLGLCQVLDGANVNLKSFDDGTYRRLNGGTLKPVLETFRTLHEQKVWFEMTTLMVPGYVDDMDMIKRMCGWILDNLGPDHPLHFLRFFPQYKLTRLAPTPVPVLEEARKTALQAGIHYVYLGNVPGHPGLNTYCHHCGKLLIERKGYLPGAFNLQDGRCTFCGSAIPGRWG